MRTFHSDLSWNFLVSSPASTAYEFKSTVVFLVEDGPETSYGVIINRPLDKCISEFYDAVADPDLGAVEVYEGGPVGITELKLGAFCMGEAEVGKFHFGVSPQRLLQIIRGRFECKPMAFLGYTGWSRQQLRDEINAGYWFLSNVDMNIIFDVPPEDLWRELLIREYPAIAKIEPPDSNVKAN